jgi:hypothetical protein
MVVREEDLDPILSLRNACRLTALAAGKIAAIFRRTRTACSQSTLAARLFLPART